MDRLRSAKYRKDDIISSLPTELVHIIFRQLSVEDLAMCRQVSKKWYSLANDNVLWMEHCLKHGLELSDVDIFHYDTSSKLCKWAQIWYSFRMGPLYGWRNSDWITHEVRRSEIFTKHATDGKLVVVCTGSALTFMVITSFDGPSITVDVPLPAHAYNDIAVENYHVAFAKNNIVLIYKYRANSCRCVLALSMEEDRIIPCKKLIKRFAQRELKKNSFRIRILAFVNEYLWIRDEDTRREIFIVNIVSGKFTTIKNYQEIFVSKPLIACSAQQKLKVFKCNGRTMMTIPREVTNINTNSHLLVTYSFSGPEPDAKQIVEAWMLSTGECKLTLEMPREAFCDIHPTNDVLYQVDPSFNTITSRCLLTGEELWTIQMPTVDDTRTWKIGVVCGKFLVVYPSKTLPIVFNKVYVFNAFSGKYLYKGIKPPGRVKHLSDNLLLTQTACAIFLITFSGIK